MCDSAVALGGETLGGITLFAKNSDRRADECQPFLQFPAARHPANARVRCTHIDIPQVAETYRVMGHSPWWVWGFEHGVNEHAVAIGNHSVFSNEVLEEKPGLIGMDLVRLGLERGRDAREALEVIATLIETHGQGGSALAPDAAGYHNSFLLADPDQAWVLETSNRRWAARRETLRSCSNHFSLNSNWEIGSRDLEPFARTRGWWKEAGRLDVAAAYRNPHVPGRISEGRERRTREWLLKGRGSLDVASLQCMLRDHGDEGAPWSGENLTSDDERYFTLCAHAEPVQWTTASMVASLPGQRTGPWPVWISFGTPCTGLFLPVYLDGVIPATLARANDALDDGSAWWVFKQLQDAASADPPRFTPMLRKKWAKLEARIEAERVEVERAARAATASRDEDRAAAIVSTFMDRTVDAALTLARRLHAQIR